jgi:uncharacterized protein YjcR
MSDLGNDKTKFRKVYVTSYYLKELADLYNVSKFIMRKKLKLSLFEKISTYLS